MKVSSVQDIKLELANLSSKEIMELCLKLVRFKKENKELLTYLLFDSHDQQGYIDLVKKEIDLEFLDLPKSNLHLTKKSLRKQLRALNKYIRYTASKEVEVEILLHFLKALSYSKIPINKTAALISIYQGQIKKVEKSISTLHEDLQYQYNKELQVLADEQKDQGNSLKGRLVSIFRK